MKEEKIKLERLHFYSNRAYGGDGETAIKPGKNDVPCVRIELDWNDELNVSARYWIHQTASSNKQESGFAPIVRLLDLPKNEAAAAVHAFEENRDKLDQWDLKRKVMEKTFWPLMEERAKQPPGKNEVAVYLRDNVFDMMGPDRKKIFKLFTGEDYSESVIPKIASLPVEKLFLLMSAMNTDANNLPNPSHFDSKNQNETDFIAWL